jgi:hypothetical protein
VSVLVIDPDETNGLSVVELLVSEGDEVGVIVADPSDAGAWKKTGAQVAIGSSADPDLIERAAQHARSIILFDARPDTVETVIEGARLVGPVPARVVYCSTGIHDVRAELESSGLEFVLLTIPVERVGLRRRRRQAVNPDSVASAVNAADDLAGELRLRIDLADDDAWRRLGLERNS